jgi:CRP/FNR family transcriptional regulator, cyclic AMP receptor protein
MARTDATEHLRKVSLFSSLDKKELETLAHLVKERRYSGGTTIVQSGQAGHGLYVITDGAVSVRKDGKTVAHLGPGDFFGEMSVLDGGPRTADVVADRDTECLTLVDWDIRPVLMANAGLTYKMLLDVVRRYRGSGAKPSD